MSDPWGPLPDLAECERALRFECWVTEGGDYEWAEQKYREVYGDLPCYAVGAPDGGPVGRYALS